MQLDQHEDSDGDDSVRSYATAQSEQEQARASESDSEEQVKDTESKDSGDSGYMELSGQNSRRGSITRSFAHSSGNMSDTGSATFSPPRHPGSESESLMMSSANPRPIRPENDYGRSITDPGVQGANYPTEPPQYPNTSQSPPHAITNGLNYLDEPSDSRNGARRPSAPLSLQVMSPQPTRNWGSDPISTPNYYSFISYMDQNGIPDDMIVGSPIHRPSAPVNSPVSPTTSLDQQSRNSTSVSGRLGIVFEESDEDES
ncbi:hypothetical protein BGZ63DRAFT_426541 [Mariannaea sp. PMI_226]|nr:hypothetical protein BGZ63DRAFT_426541 [Mariannaea sp. PMI_226]